MAEIAFVPSGDGEAVNAYIKRAYLRKRAESIGKTCKPYPPALKREVLRHHR